MLGTVSNCLVTHKVIGISTTTDYEDSLRGLYLYLFNLKLHIIYMVKLFNFK